MTPTILITGAGGFIGGSLVRYFRERFIGQIRAVDKKPLSQWYQRFEDVENLCLDVSQFKACQRAVEGVSEVYNLAADMGGMGFITVERVNCLRNILITANLLETAYRAGVERYFFSSSACAYNTTLQIDPNVTALKESDAFPANAERGYGWEKLLSEMFCQEYWAERGLKTFIARFHSCYGPHGTWDGGREKAPAALSRKVIAALDGGQSYINIWGDGTQTRTYMYIDDCVSGIDRITHCDALVGTPVNLGSTELVSVDQLVTTIEAIAGVTLERRYQPDAPKGVGGRNSDNTLLKQHLGWEPSIPLSEGIVKTYAWVNEQYQRRKAGHATIV